MVRETRTPLATGWSILLRGRAVIVPMRKCSVIPAIGTLSLARDLSPFMPWNTLGQRTRAWRYIANYFAKHIANHITKHIAHHIPNDITKHFSNYFANYSTNRVTNYIPNNIANYFTNNIANNIANHFTNIIANIFANHKHSLSHGVAYTSVFWPQQHLFSMRSIHLSHGPL